MRDTYIIAEIGSNWAKTKSLDKNLEIAFQQIIAAKEANVNAVKFQYFTHKKLYGFDSDCIKNYELPSIFLKPLYEKAQSLNLDFICSVFDPEDVDIVNKYVIFHKIAAPEVDYVELRSEMLKTRKPVIVSITNPNEIHCGLYNILCVSKYPATIMDYDLKILTQNHMVGISDHTLTPDLAVIVRKYYPHIFIFEKHFDALNDLGPTPDSHVSIGYIGMCDYVKSINSAFIDIENKNMYKRQKIDRGYFRVKYA